MEDLCNKKTIIKILKERDIPIKKSFGQNFLINKDTLNLIIKTAKISNNDYIIEIGPGVGTLTQELIKKAKNVTSIELDKNLIPILESTFKNKDNLEIINKNALKYAPRKKRYKIVANIPYNITSPLIIHFLQAKSKPSTITLLTQKEVAEKICYKEKISNILSLQVALYGQAKIIRKIPPHCFYPAPKVDSAILHIETIKKSDPNYTTDIDAKNIIQIAKLAYSQKRKTLSNSLSKGLKKQTQKITQILENLKINPKIRPEKLTINEWKSLSKKIKPLLN